MEISRVLFDRQFANFNKKLRLQSGQGFVSFRAGLPKRWEHYKERLRDEALVRLDVRSWRRKDIGSGRIVNCAIKAIEINEPRRGFRNNLVDWPNIYGHQRRSHWALLDAKKKRKLRYELEKWFYDFFKNAKTEDETAFESFRALAGSRYDLIAYLFYLKDWNRFMPIATQTFDKAFRLLHCDLVTSHHCSWENYSRYTEILLAVQKCLLELQGIREARLIDAHSFCWMLVRLKISQTTKPIIPLPIAVTDIRHINVGLSELLDDGQFDPVDDDAFFEKHAKNHQLGKLAQYIALKSERKRAKYADPDAVQPKWKEPKRGYDILSREPDGTARYIEVKAGRNAGKTLSFFVTDYEWRMSRKKPNYYFYLVLNVRSAKAKVIMLHADQLRQKHLTPTNYLASFAATF